jgi:hypothetical protein
MKINGIKIIKMTTGEEIIGDMNQQGDNVTVTNPATVHLVPGESGKMGMAMIPFAPYAEEDSFMFNLAHIMTSYTPGLDLLNQYNQRFGSGIVVARNL